MRYQALFLILVILLSVTLMKGVGMLSHEANTDIISVAELTRAVEVAQSPLASLGAQESPVVLQPVAGNPISARAGYAEEQTRLEHTDLSSQAGFGQDACADVQASIAYVRDTNSGALLYSRNIAWRWPIASITKLMTAVIAMEHFDTKEQVEITSEDIAKTEGYATFSAGTTLTVNDMIRALLVGSSNDAAFALAAHMGEKEFVGRMQAKAQELDMSQTTFYEPSGLSFLNQSTASDLYLLTRYIQHTHPYLLESTRLKSITVWDYGQGRNKTVANIDSFAGRSDFLGGKTGFIDQSGGNLVTLFKSGGKELFVAVLGSDDRFAEIEELLACAREENGVAAR